MLSVMSGYARRANPTYALMDARRYEHVARQLQGIGRELGGWLRGGQVSA